ncbi:hypothetical protein GCM10025868_16680 [Angustibacter aerolatus]|uniref:Uncharacterized protein n=1 Tax=Angustibacter aerolatus TaxID=1162965 RepID=A0ABQ6JG79_9ACTN|nr:hypothetical protein GCM10025868_16680 [Angustibacter aerolatus]
MLFWYGESRRSTSSVPWRVTGRPYQRSAVTSAVEKQPVTSAGRSRANSASAGSAPGAWCSVTPRLVGGRLQRAGEGARRGGMRLVADGAVPAGGEAAQHADVRLLLLLVGHQPEGGEVLAEQQRRADRRQRGLGQRGVDIGEHGRERVVRHHLGRHAVLAQQQGPDAGHEVEVQQPGQALLQVAWQG